MAIRFRVLACGLVATLLLIGSQTPEVVRRLLAFQSHWNALRQVDATDGIQSAEADLIAAEYSGRLLGRWSACSGTTSPSLVGGAWKAEILFGFGGEPTGRWISVDPTSGGASSPGESGYQSFESLRRAVLLNALLDGY